MNLAKLILLIFLALQILCQAQSINAQEMGTVSVSITSNTYIFDAKLEKDMEWSPPASEQPPLKVKLRGNVSGTDFVKEISLQDRRKKVDNYHKEYFIDEYEVQIGEGFYVIEIDGISTYQFPKFLVKENEVVKFDVPARKFIETLCDEKDRYADVEINGIKLSDSKDSNGKSAYNLLQTETLTLVNPFEIVVSYCGKETDGQIIKYKNAEIRYKNLTI